MCARYSECPGSDQHSNPGAQTSSLLAQPADNGLWAFVGAPHSSYTTYDVAGGGGGGGNSGGTDAFAVDGETCGGYMEGRTLAPACACDDNACSWNAVSPPFGWKCDCASVAPSPPLLGGGGGRPGGGLAGGRDPNEVGVNCCGGGGSCGYQHCPALGADESGCVQPWYEHTNHDIHNSSRPGLTGCFFGRAGTCRTG